MAELFCYYKKLQHAVKPNFPEEKLPSLPDSCRNLALAKRIVICPNFLRSEILIERSLQI